MIVTWTWNETMEAVGLGRPTLATVAAGDKTLAEDIPGALKAADNIAAVAKDDAVAGNETILPDGLAVDG